MLIKVETEVSAPIEVAAPQSIEQGRHAASVHSTGNTGYIVHAIR